MHAPAPSSILALTSSPIPTFAIDNRHTIILWNPACEALTALAAARMEGTDTHWRAFYSQKQPLLVDLIVDDASLSEVQALCGNGFRQTLLVEGGYEGEGYFSESSEGPRWLFLTAAPLKDHAGKVWGAVQTVQDITARKQDEEELRHNFSKLDRRAKEFKQQAHTFRSVADFTYDWEYWINPEGRLLYLSPSFERITGYSRDAFTHCSHLLKMITHPDEQSALETHHAQERMTDAVFHLDFRITTQTGEERWISHYCQPVIADDGSHLGRRASNRDITQRKQLEAALVKERLLLKQRVEERTHELTDAYAALLQQNHDLERLYEGLRESREELSRRNELIEAILDNLPIGIAVGSIDDGLARYMNPKFIEIYGWPREVLSDFESFLVHVYPDPRYRSAIQRRTLQDIATGDPAKMIWNNLAHTTSSGEQRIVNVKGIPLFNREFILSIVQDVTERHLANETLRFTRFSINHADDMIYWLGQEGRIVDVNDTLCAKLNYSRDQLLSMDIGDINPNLTAETFRLHWQSVLKKSSHREQTTHRTSSGTTIPVETHTSHITFSGREYACIFARDLTERKELERLLSIQDKMSSLGRVAAGIAHEIRNPLSTINVYLSTLKKVLIGEESSAEHRPDLADVIQEMNAASRKIEAVVKRVMDFSKPGKGQMQMTGINRCVTNAIELSAVTLRKSGVTLEVNLAKNLPKTLLDEQLIEQVIINLLTNALEELSEQRGERRVAISTMGTITNSGGHALTITVADSGSGVTADHAEKIFDPFFTTKYYGSGIGLSLCQRIISDHHGMIYVQPSQWGGAMFIIELPVRQEAEKR